jgi:hypothetical protein
MASNKDLKKFYSDWLKNNQQNPRRPLNQTFVHNSDLQNSMTRHNLRPRKTLNAHQANQQNDQLEENVVSNIHPESQIRPSQQSPDAREVSNFEKPTNFQKPTDIEFENKDFKLFIEKGM